MQSNCLDIVRRHDPDRFLLSLMVPQRYRPSLWALFAFNYEIAKTREVVSETMIGLIRLQWWRDAIDEIYSDKPVRKHEVVDALCRIIEQYDLPREDFDALIYAREFDLEGVTPANLSGLMKYCEYTATPLNRLVLKICGQFENESTLNAISSHYALIGTLRAVPYMLNQRRLMLPQDMLSKYNISEQKLFDFNEKENLPKVVMDIITSQNQLRYAATGVKSPFLKAMQKMSYLYRVQLESVQGDVFDSALHVPPRFMALRVWVSSKT